MSFMQHSPTTLIHWSRLCPRRRHVSRARPPSSSPHPPSCPHIICHWINKNCRWIMDGGGGNPEGRKEGMMKGKQTLISLSERRKNQNKQILLKLFSFFFRSFYRSSSSSPLGSRSTSILSIPKWARSSCSSTKIFTCVVCVLTLEV